MALEMQQDKLRDIEFQSHMINRILLCDVKERFSEEERELVTNVMVDPFLDDFNEEGKVSKSEERLDKTEGNLELQGKEVSAAEKTQPFGDFSGGIFSAEGLITIPERKDKNEVEALLDVIITRIEKMHDRKSTESVNESKSEDRDEIISLLDTVISNIEESRGREMIFSLVKSKLEKKLKILERESNSISAVFEAKKTELNVTEKELEQSLSSKVNCEKKLTECKPHTQTFEVWDVEDKLREKEEEEARIKAEEEAEIARIAAEEAAALAAYVEKRDAEIRSEIKGNIIQLQREEIEFDIIAKKLSLAISNNEKEAMRIQALEDDENADDAGKDDDDDDDDENGGDDEDNEGDKDNVSNKEEEAENPEEKAETAKEDEENVKGNENQDENDYDDDGDDSTSEESEPIMTANEVSYPVTSNEELEKMEGLKNSIFETITLLKDSNTNLQEEYEKMYNSERSYKASSIEIAEILLTQFFYVLTEKRNDVWLRQFYREVIDGVGSRLLIDCSNEIVGCESIMQALIDSFVDVDISLDLHPFEFDSNPPSHCAAFVKCNYTVRINKEKPRRMLLVFELDFDDGRWDVQNEEGNIIESKAGSMYIRKQVFVIRSGQRPLFIWPSFDIKAPLRPKKWPRGNKSWEKKEKPKKIKNPVAYDEDGKLVPGVEEGLIPAKIVDPNWKPTIKFYDNREPFRKELELMSLEDFNCPISADIRTDDEIKMASQHYHNAMKSNEDTSKRFGDEDHTLAHSQQNDDGNMGTSTTLTSFFGRKMTASPEEPSNRKSSFGLSFSRGDQTEGKNTESETTDEALQTGQNRKSMFNRLW